MFIRKIYQSRSTNIIFLGLFLLCYLSCNTADNASSEAESSKTNVDDSAAIIESTEAANSKLLTDSFNDVVFDPLIEYLDSFDQKTTTDDSLYLISPCNMILKSQLAGAFVTSRPIVNSFLKRNQGFMQTLSNYKIDRIDAQALTVDQDSLRKDLKWPNPSVVNFVFARRSFPTQQEYEVTRAAMLQAAADWNKLTNVQFRYYSNGGFDNSIQFNDIRALFRNNHIGMVVAYQNYTPAIFRNRNVYNTSYAIAFNKKFTLPERVLRICSRFFQPGNLSQSGILRHEIGHIMGFRHEHTNAPQTSNCPKEDFGFARSLTDYDKNSVMHYACGGFSNYQYRFTRLDTLGIKKIYQ